MLIQHYSMYIYECTGVHTSSKGINYQYTKKNTKF